LQPVTRPLLAALTVIFPFIADISYYLYHNEDQKAREKSSLCGKAEDFRYEFAVFEKLRV
jgi:hypothetical protein